MALAVEVTSWSAASVYWLEVTLVQAVLWWFGHLALQYWLKFVASLVA